MKQLTRDEVFDIMLESEEYGCLFLFDFSDEQLKEIIERLEGEECEIID